MCVSLDPPGDSEARYIPKADALAAAVQIRVVNEHFVWSAARVTQVTRTKLVDPRDSF